MFYVTLLAYFEALDKIFERFQSFARFNIDLEMNIFLETPIKYFTPLVYLGSIYSFKYLL